MVKRLNQIERDSDILNLMTFHELAASAPVVTDGAWGTELQRLGLEPGAPADLWNLSRPDHVRAVAASYVAAGSRVILTNTFRSNRVALGAQGVGDRIAEINRAGVRISREAAGGAAAVFASVGPTGKLLISGDITESDLRAAFDEQVNALAEAGPDAIVLETFADLSEATIAVETAKQTGLPVIVSFVFDSGRKGDRTMMGVTPETAVQAAEAAGASAAGANCGRGIADYVGICARMRSATSLPIWIKPNAGLPEIEAGKAVYRTSAEDFAARVPDLTRAGASFIGGCCGSNPEFIAATIRALS
jgi:methionine synthase I (cobalamin-dependent)